MPDYVITADCSGNYFDGTNNNNYTYTANQTVTETTGNAPILAFLEEAGLARLSTYTPPSAQTIAQSPPSYNGNNAGVSVGDSVTILEPVSVTYDSTTVDYTASQVVTATSANVNALNLLVLSGLATE